MSRLRSHILLILGIAMSTLLLVQFLRMLQPGHDRAIAAACRGMDPSPTNPNLGDLRTPVPAIDFSLQDSTGKTVSLADFRGKIVIVNFWASWCAVCRSEKPSLEEFQDEYRDEEVVVLALASDRDWGAVRLAMMGFDVKTAREVLDNPHEYGVRDPQAFDGDPNALVVTRVDKGRPASQSGLKRLDRISAVNGQPVSRELESALRAAGETTSFSVVRKSSGQAVQKSISIEAQKNLKVLLDPPRDDGNLGGVAKDYGITAVPESFVVDRQGMIRHYFINKRNWDGDIANTCLQELVDG